MAENTVNGVAKEPVANADDKAPNAAENPPSVAKEPVAKSEGATEVSVTADSTAPPTSGSSAEPKPEPSAAAADQGVSAKVPAENETPATEPEKSSEPAAQPTSTEIAASDASAGASTNEAKAPKPVSVEEKNDEDLSRSKALAAEKAEETALKGDAAAPVATTDAETTGAPAKDSSSAANDNVTAGGKRKAEDAAKIEAVHSKDEDVKRPGKKPKTNGAATTNGTARKPGRPRKEKKAVAPVGKTARKTRSQGAAD